MNFLWILQTYAQRPWLFTVHCSLLTNLCVSKTFLTGQRIEFFEVEPMKKRTLLLRAASRFDLPADALAGTARVTLTGPRRLLIENHRGLLNLENHCVIVDTGPCRLTVLGEGLRLNAMNRCELLITGQIFSVEWE